MNGAESLVRTLVMNGVDVCFTNPGTSEMHFVAALDKVDGMRCVLGMFEGVVTGAADAYYRMTGRPASTLLHLGPGLGNGLANLHDAKKAGSGIVNIVGEHATYHLKHDAPLTSDIEGVARPMSHWVRTSANARTLAGDCARAIHEARRPPGRIATLIAPADTAWNEADGPAEAEPPPPRSKVDAAAVTVAARALTSGDAAMAGAPGQRATDMLTLDRPDLAWVSLARGHGVEGSRAATLDELAGALRAAFSRRGPYLVELKL
jgi:acetolactate synthase-1/2/3 large subunit